MLLHHSPPNRCFSNMPSLNRHLPNQHSPNQCLLIRHSPNRHFPNRRLPNRHYLLSHLHRHTAVQSYQLSILHKLILIIIPCFQLPFIQTGQRHPFLVLHTTQLAYTSFIFKFNTFIYQSIIQFFLATYLRQYNHVKQSQQTIKKKSINLSQQPNKSDVLLNSMSVLST